MWYRLPFEKVKKVRSVVGSRTNIVGVITIEGLKFGRENLLGTLIVDRFFEYIEPDYVPRLDTGQMYQIERMLSGKPAGICDLQILKWRW